MWLVVTVAFMAVFQIKSVSVTNFHWPSALVALFPFVVFIVVCTVYLSKIKRQICPNEDGLMLGEKILEFTEDGFTDKNSMGESFYKWAAIEDIVENSGDVHIS